MSKDFFKELGKVTREEVPRELDDLILKANKSNKPRFSFGLALIPVAAVVILFFVSNQEILELKRNRGLFENYEVITAIDEFDPLEITDEEWEVLLEEKDG